MSVTPKKKNEEEEENEGKCEQMIYIVPSVFHFLLYRACADVSTFNSGMGLVSISIILSRVSGLGSEPLSGV